MNIKITYNWLLEYLDTDASPYEMQKYLSLSGPSIERVHKVGDDYVFDIEITSNRIDMASVIGIAQEAQAILPMFGKKAKLKSNPLTDLKLKGVKPASGLNLKIDIKKTNLVSRFTAVVFDQIKITESPEFIKKRLSAVGVKVINNVVDISNYLMITLGQPIHMFDYEKIEGQKMIVRESKKGEKIKTLDEREITLPGGDTVIEDGSGRLVDLCGIMGGHNSAIGNTTKRVILFVQTYNKEKVRKTVMTTNQRTLAATYFEKGLDEERVEAAIVLGTQLIEKYCQGKVASKIYDIFPHPYEPIKLSVEKDKFSKLIGIQIEAKVILKILSNLGFTVSESGQFIKALVPASRKFDVSISEDLVEEVARIYGYHNLPNRIPPVRLVNQDEAVEKLFKIQQKLKYFLKHLGLNEVINYSMVSENLLASFNLEKKNHLRIANTISEEIEYMRQSLLPSLYKNVVDNVGKKELLRFFEVAKVYLPRKNNLPQEIYRLGISTNTNYFDVKGIMEAILKEFNIREKIEYKIEQKDNVYLCEIDFDLLIKNARLLPDYQPINPYSVVKLEKTFVISNKRNYKDLQEMAFKSKILKKIEVVSLYKDRLSLRFYYSSVDKNITEADAKRELDKLV